MSIKELFGFGGKKDDREYCYPSAGYYGDEYVYPRQSYSEPLPRQKTNSMPPLGDPTFVFPNCTVTTMSVEKLLKTIQPDSNSDNTATDTGKTSEDVVNNSALASNNTTISKDKASTVSTPENGTKPVRSTLAQQRELIILNVEITPTIFERKDNVTSVINSILSSKKEALFLLSRLGKTSTFFTVMDYEDITSSKILTEIFTFEEPIENTRLADAFSHIDTYSKKNLWPRLDFKNTAYWINSCSIICIGNRDTIDKDFQKENMSKPLYGMSTRFKVDTFNYLCFTKETGVNVFTLKIPKTKPGIYIPIKPQTKEVIVFVVENTPSILGHKNTFMALLNQIAGSQKTALFLMVKLGTSNQCSELIDYEAVSKNGLISQLFDDSVSTEETKLAGVLKQVKDKLTPIVTSKFTFKNIDYLSSSISFVFIGSGSSEEDEKSKEAIANCIKTFTRWPKTKNLKYLCVSDRQTIKVASLGFPDIKHIITNFYY